MREVRCQAPLDKVMVGCSRTPISLAYIAAILEKKHTCKIVDYPAQNSGRAEFIRDIGEFSPDMIIANLTARTYQDDIKSYKVAKSVNSNIRTVAFGGAFPNVVSLIKEDAYLDLFVCQEPEEAFNEIAEERPLNDIRGIIYKENNSVVDNSEAVHVDDMDSLPYPSRDLLNNRLYIRPDTNKMQTEIEVSRGCPGKCIFCMAPAAHGKKTRARSPGNIIGEIEECINRFKIGDFFFRADTFTWDKNWVVELCREIVSRKLTINWCCNSRVDTVDAEMLSWMKRAGCWLISFGIESGNQNILNKVKKGLTLEACRKAISLCKESGIRTYLNFMIGFPWDDENTIMQTLNFAKEIDGDIVEFPLVTPFPGTELYSFAKRERLISERKDISEQFPLPTLYLNSEEVFRLWRKVVLSYYCRPGYIYKTMSRAIKEGVALNYLRFGTKKIMDIYGQYHKKTLHEHI